MLKLEDLKPLIGKTLLEAEKFLAPHNMVVRMSRLNGSSFRGGADHKPNRVNVSVVDNKVGKTASQYIREIDKVLSIG
jgi:hypothetical protein